MKTKRFAKIVTLTLTALLLIGAAVGITVSASDTGATEIAIAGQNISYEGAPQILYYVKADGLSENQTVKIDLQHGDGEVYTKTVAKNEDGTDMTATISGQTYYIVYSKGIAPKDMTKTVTAKAYIDNGDGTTISATEEKTYSIYEYAMNRFSKAPTEDQVTLYKALLDYGAAVQAVFAENNAEVAADIDKYGWADAYYKTTANVYVDGEKTDTVISSNNERAVNLVDSEGRYNVVNLGEWYNGAAFLKMTKANDATRISTVAAPGVQEYDVYYVNSGNFQDFENLTDVTELFEGGTATAWYDYAYVALNKNYDTTTTHSYLYVGDDSDNKVLITGNKANTDTTYWWIDANDGVNEAEIGRTYVVDFDFKMIKTGQKLKTDAEQLRLNLAYLTDDIRNGTGNLLVRNPCVYPTSSGEESYYIDATAGVPVALNEWYDIRLEYEITGESAAMLTVFINGIEEYSVSTTKAYAPEAFYFWMVMCDSDQEYAFDNFYYYNYLEGETGVRRGQGKYYNESLNNRTGATVYDFSDTSVTSNIANLNGGVVNNYTAGKTNITVADGIFSTSVENTAWNCYAINNTAVTTAAGETAIIEFDYMFKAPGATTGSQGYIKIYTGSTAIGYVGWSAYDDYATISSSKQLKKDVWYNIRIEITDTAGVLYVDNALVGNVSMYSSAVSSTGYSAGFKLYLEHKATATGYSYCIDNLVFDNINTAPDPTYWEQYEAGTLTEGKYKAYDFETLPELIDNGFASKTDTTAETYIVAENGVLTWGQNAAVDKHSRIVVGLEGAGVGDKWVVEFDYKFGGMEPITTYGTNNWYGNLNVYHGNGSSIAAVYFAARGASVTDSTNALFNNAAPAVALSQDVWYKIRIEIEITEYGTDTDGDGEAYEYTRTLYIDDAKILAQSSTSNEYLQKINQIYLNLKSNCPKVQNYMDNLVVVLVEAE